MSLEEPAAQLVAYPDESDPRFVWVAGRRLARVAGGSGEGEPAGDGGEDPSGSGDSGQGGIGDLYDLESVPEELRPYLEEQLKGVAGKVGQRLEDHANYRKQWEPLEKIEGLRDVPADEMSELIAFHGILQDEDSFKEWWEDAGERLGLFDDEDDEGEEEGLEGGEEPPQWAKDLRQELEELKGTVKPLSESTAEQEKQRRIDAATSKIEADFKEIDPDGKLDEEAKEDIAALALPFGEQDDAIAKGFKRYQQITGRAKGDLADDTLGQPDPANPGGPADTSPEKFDSIDDPRLKATLKARLAGAGAG